MVKNKHKKKILNKNSLVVITFLVVLLFDLVTKSIIKRTMEIGESKEILTGIFHITHYRNFGAGFGILQHQQTLLIFVAIAVIGVILFYYDKIPDNKLALVSAGLILGGAVGNLYDRLFLGYVTDFLDFQIWPIFNIADAALSAGVIGTLYYSFFIDKQK